MRCELVSSTAQTARRTLSTLVEMGVIAVKREGRLRKYLPILHSGHCG
ncbi:hypothetical protein ASZ90_010367 [hydrocarbon metagenome]|uniref:Uncharacterized protein n=1 Tax=hydrocarbon metagenome TaxID=938273 RepID=A0A0W8FGD6_9ZZZZ